MMKNFKKIIALVFLLPIAAAAGSIRDYYDEPGINPFKNLGNQDFVEEVDTFSGMLRIGLTDTLIPGNGGFDLTIRRTYSTPAIGGETTPYGYGWTLHFGRVVVGTLDESKVCAQHQWATSVIDNPSIELPDGSRKLLVLADYHNTYLITKDWWSAECVSGNLVVKSPDGTTYYMDYRHTDGTIVSKYATHIEDANGNSIDINYNTSSAGMVYIDSISTSDGRSVDFNYDGQGTANIRLSSIVANGQTWTYEYSYPSGLSNPPAQLTKITRPDGRSWEFDYYPLLTTGDAGSLALSDLQTPMGGTIAYEYDFTNFEPGPTPTVTTVVSSKTKGGTNVSPGTWTYDYKPGFASATGYDETTVFQPDGIRKDYHVGYSSVYAGQVWRTGLKEYAEVYDNSGNVKEQINYVYAPMVISNENFWHGRDTNRIDTATYAPVLEEIYHYRENNAVQTLFSNHNAYGQPQTVTKTSNITGDPGRVTSYIYSNNASTWILGLVTEEVLVHSNGAPVTSWSIERDYDSSGNLLREDRYGVESIYTYTTEGDVNTFTDANNNTTTYSDYFRGIPRLEEQPEGVTIERTVNPTGTLSSETNGRGHTTSFSWDGLNRLSAISYPTNYGVSVSYGPNSRTITRGNYEESVTWDGFGRELSSTKTDLVTLESLHVSQSRDSMGRVVFQSYPNDTAGITTSYDIFNRPVTVSHDNGNHISYDYITAAYTEVTDENGKTTTRLEGYYGTLEIGSGVLVNISAPESITTAIRRNGLNQIWQVFQGEQQPNGQILGLARAYTHDSRGFLSSEINPETGETVYTHDAVGNVLTKEVGASGIVETRSYDGRSRIIATEYSDATDDVIYSYDDDDNVLSIFNGLALRDYSYDENGNLIEESLVVGSSTYTLEYQVNALDYVESLVYPSSREVDFSPDALNRETQALPYASQVDYHPNGQLQNLSLANGVLMQLTQDNRLRPLNMLVSGLSGSVLDITYGYDNSKNITSITDALGTLHDAVMTYDDVNRLTSAQGDWGLETVAYDALGNIITKERNGVYQDYSYSSMRLVYRLFPTHSLTLNYDDHGNITNDGVIQYTYNAANRMTSATFGVNTAVYQYDGQGMRVARSEGADEVHYFYSASGQLMGEYHADGTFEEYVYIAGTPAVRISGDLSNPSAPEAETYYHANIVGSPIAATDASGNLLWEQAYGPWGEPQSPVAGEPLGFAGASRDSLSELSDLQARWYSPTLGRLMALDPVTFHEGNFQSFNLYAYANNNPYRFIDPDGRTPEEALAQERTSSINYRSTGISGTFPLGGGYTQLEFEMLSPNGQSQVNFSGTVLTTNYGVGIDLSGVVSEGVLTGPYIPWSRSAAMDALNGQLVTGSGFTFSIGNGLVVGGTFNVGSYSDSKGIYQVRGVSVGWEGFRGTLYLDPESFSVTRVAE